MNQLSRTIPIPPWFDLTRSTAQERIYNLFLGDMKALLGGEWLRKSPLKTTLFRLMTGAPFDETVR